MKYRSKFEAKLAKSLEDRGIAFKYESMSLEYYTKVKNGVCFDCQSKSGCYQQHWYTPDFTLDNRKDLIIEAKGRFTASDRTKMLAVKEAHDDLDIRFVFMANNKIHKKSDMRYADWCERHGFKYSIGTIPTEWSKLI